MIYPLDLSHRDKGTVPILEIAFDLHMVCNGSSDVIPSSDVHHVVTYLRLRCQHWTPTPDTKDHSFDSAVLALLQAAIAEGNRWMAARDRDRAEDDEAHAHDDDLIPNTPRIQAI
ncbi:MAG: hypothetical protein ABL983_00235 [Nitrospira sp.]